MQFRIKVIAPGNHVSALDIEAASETLAREAAEQQGYAVLAVSAPAFGMPAVLRARSRFSVTLFSIELLALLDAGLNLVEALQGLAEKASTDEARDVLGRIVQCLNEGESC
jgi:general secretion pathway protein F